MSNIAAVSNCYYVSQCINYVEYGLQSYHLANVGAILTSDLCNHQHDNMT